MWHGFRPFKRRGLRTWVLTMLSRSPKNGAEIMDEIESMSQGWWRPSPGSVYPLLDEMTQEGLIKKREDGRYEISEKAKNDTEWGFGPFGAFGPFASQFMGPRRVEDMLGEINGYVNYFEDLAKTAKDKLAPHADRIRAIADRLSALSERR